MPAEAINIKDYLEKIKVITDDLLEKYLPDVESEPKILHQAMRYSVLAGGKRIA